MQKILIIEDDKEILEILKSYLARYSMEVTGATQPSKGLKILEKEKFDLIILDLSLPEMDGLEVCKIITRKYKIPVIISTARSDVSDRVLGLELGADDYLPKPYDPRELVARIQSVLRRSHNGQVPSESEFEIDETRMVISQSGKLLDLTLAEYEILRLMLTKKHRVLSREMIIDNVDAIKWDSSDKSIDVIISRIRSKIGDSSKEPKYIKSIRGVGYKYIGS